MILNIIYPIAFLACRIYTMCAKNSAEEQQTVRDVYGYVSDSAAVGHGYVLM